LPGFEPKLSISLRTLGGFGVFGKDMFGKDMFGRFERSGIGGGLDV
jgi:hypothetical protein